MKGADISQALNHISSIDRNKVKIAIIGMTTPEVPYITKPGSLKHITVDRPEDILPRLMKKAKR